MLGALPSCIIELQMMLVILWMCIEHRMTEQSVAEAIETLLRAGISAGEVANACKLVAWAFEPFCQSRPRI